MHTHTDHGYFTANEYHISHVMPETELHFDEGIREKFTMEWLNKDQAKWCTCVAWQELLHWDVFFIQQNPCQTIRKRGNINDARQHWRRTTGRPFVVYFFNFVRKREVAQTHINGREILEIFERLRTPCHKKQLINENEVEKISSPVNGLKRPYIVCRSKASYTFINKIYSATLSAAHVFAGAGYIHDRCCVLISKRYVTHVDMHQCMYLYMHRWRELSAPRNARSLHSTTIDVTVEVV